MIQWYAHTHTTKQLAWWNLSKTHADWTFLSQQYIYIYIYTSWCGNPHVLAGDWELEESTCIADFSYWGVGMVMMCLFNVPKNSLVLLADRGLRGPLRPISGSPKNEDIRNIIGFNRISTVCFGGSRKEYWHDSSFQPWRCFSLWVCWRETRNFHDFHGRKTMVTSWFAHVSSVDFPANITWGNHEVTIHYKHEVSMVFSSYPCHVFQSNPLIRSTNTLMPRWGETFDHEEGKGATCGFGLSLNGSAEGFIWNGLCGFGGTPRSETIHTLVLRSWRCQCFFEKIHELFEKKTHTNVLPAQFFFCWQREHHILPVRF